MKPNELKYYYVESGTARRDAANETYRQLLGKVW